jgi:hypothetical protein
MDSLDIWNTEEDTQYTCSWEGIWQQSKIKKDYHGFTVNENVTN